MYMYSLGWGEDQRLDGRRKREEGQEGVIAPQYFANTKK